jgi:hypothetical protein
MGKDQGRHLIKVTEGKLKIEVVEIWGIGKKIKWKSIKKWKKEY